MRENGFYRYLGEIEGHPLLDAAEERRLGCIVQERAGSAAARQAWARLIECNLRLVVSVAMKHEGRGVDLEELAAEGNLGLVKAAGRWNPLKFRNRFSTYAVWWIRQNMQEAIRRREVVPRSRARRRRLARVQRGACYKYGEAEQNVEELAKETGLSVREIEEALGDRIVVLSLQDGSPEAPDLPLESAIADPSPGVQPGVAHDIEMMVRALERSLSRLERDVVERRYGLMGERETLKEVGSGYGLTTEAIRRVELRALRKLAESLGVVDGHGPARAQLNTTGAE